MVCTSFQICVLFVVVFAVLYGLIIASVVSKIFDLCFLGQKFFDDVKKSLKHACIKRYHAERCTDLQGDIESRFNMKKPLKAVDFQGRRWYYIFSR
jgi:hypothetical protein